jgi:glycosyltransferase involved in cell wall biosynthesis
VRLAVVLEQCLAPVPGGTGRYSREVARALARAAGPGDEVVGVVAWHRDVAAAQLDGVRLHRLPLPRRALVAAWERGLGPSVAADVVLAPTPLWPGRRTPPAIVVVHDAVPWTHPETLTPRGVAWHRRVIPAAVRTAALVVVPTQAVADELARHVDLRDVLVVGEGVTADLALPVDADARAAALALPERFLLTVATLEPRKGLDVLIAALGTPGAPTCPCSAPDSRAGAARTRSPWAAAAGLPPGRVRAARRVGDPDLAVLLERATALGCRAGRRASGCRCSRPWPSARRRDERRPALVEVGGGGARVSPLAPQPLAAALAAVARDGALRSRMAADGRRRAGGVLRGTRRRSACGRRRAASGQAGDDPLDSPGPADARGDRCRS